ncbi:MAG: SDR family NAD(P)-dependent oxidoreductase [Pseudonocardia sp.]|nr:SDR family NAD(P)-dependent oxidoreductase [Pseudonocardia sp.]
MAPYQPGTADPWLRRSWSGARDPERGTAAAAALAEDGLAVEVLALDVTSDDSVKQVEYTHGRLDVLVNNAGIVGSRVGPLETGADEKRLCYETNVFGPVRVTRAFLPLLRRSPNPRVVMVSSGLGSLAVTSEPGRLESTVNVLPYPSSKTALNMITTQYAKALPEFRINAVDPGYTATDLNGHSGTQSVEEASDAVVALAGIGPDGPTGGFFDRNGPVPW